MHAKCLSSRVFGEGRTFWCLAEFAHTFRVFLRDIALTVYPVRIWLIYVTGAFTPVVARERSRALRGDPDVKAPCFGV